jgi:hypothetical protein
MNATISRAVAVCAHTLMHVIFLLQDIPALDVINLSANGRLSLLRCVCVCVCVCVFVCVSVCVCVRERERERVCQRERERERVIERERKERQTVYMGIRTWYACMRGTHTDEDITLEYTSYITRPSNIMISFHSIQYSRMCCQGNKLHSG